MTSYPDRRFARLRLPVEHHPDATITLTVARPGDQPTPETHAVLGQIAASDPTRAALLARRLRALIAREAEVLAWLERDPANTAVFLRDPAAALHAALDDLPPDFFAGWRG